MKKFRVLAAALAAAALMAGCGGSEPGDQTSRVKFGKMVNFGDSLSDVGTYKTTFVAANGGGQYSVNGDFSAQGLRYTNWTQFLAAQFAVAQPCAAEVGLQSVGALAFMAQPVAAVANCFSFAQGGSRVTAPVGPGNALLFTQSQVASGQIGNMTKPVVTQVATYLSTQSAFAADDLITVFAGGNDAFMNRATVDGTVAALVSRGVPIGSAPANAAIADAAARAVTAMGAAGAQLAALVTGQIIAKGGKHVVVINLPDISVTPDGVSWLNGPTGPAVEAVYPHFEAAMVKAFNDALSAGLSVNVTTQTSSLPEVVYVDAFTVSNDQILHPEVYGLTNLTKPACDLTRTGVKIGATVVPIASSLFCTPATLITDPAHVTAVDPNGVMHYQYADAVHLTPYSNGLLARLVAQRMAVKGWL